jgi:hypothetical protein
MARQAAIGVADELAADTAAIDAEIADRTGTPLQGFSSDLQFSAGRLYNAAARLRAAGDSRRQCLQAQDAGAGRALHHARTRDLARMSRPKSCRRPKQGRRQTRAEPSQGPALVFGNPRRRSGRGKRRSVLRPDDRRDGEARCPVRHHLRRAPSCPFRCACRPPTLPHGGRCRRQSAPSRPPPPAGSTRQSQSTARPDRSCSIQPSIR